LGEKKSYVKSKVTGKEMLEGVALIWSANRNKHEEPRAFLLE
jgi:hypothetical protein